MTLLELRSAADLVREKREAYLAPCCQDCPHVQECAARELACGVFAAYIHGRKPWRRYGRNPSRRWFEACFPKTDSVREVSAAVRAAVRAAPLDAAA